MRRDNGGTFRSLNHGNSLMHKRKAPPALGAGFLLIGRGVLLLQIAEVLQQRLRDLEHFRQLLHLGAGHLVCDGNGFSRF